MVTVSEAAGLVGLTEGRIRQLIRSKELPAIQIGKKTYLIKRGDLDRIKSQPKGPGRPRGGST